LTVKEKIKTQWYWIRFKWRLWDTWKKGVLVLLTGITLTSMLVVSSTEGWYKRADIYQSRYNDSYYKHYQPKLVRPACQLTIYRAGFYRMGGTIYFRVDVRYDNYWICDLSLYASQMKIEDEAGYWYYDQRFVYEGQKNINLPKFDLEHSLECEDCVSYWGVIPSGESKSAVESGERVEEKDVKRINWMEREFRIIVDTRCIAGPCNATPCNTDLFWEIPVVV